MIEYVAYSFAAMCVVYFGWFFGIIVYKGIQSAKAKGGRWWLTE